MKYGLLKNVVNFLEEFETENFKRKTYSNDIGGFKRWIATNCKSEGLNIE